MSLGAPTAQSGPSRPGFGEAQTTCPLTKLLHCGSSHTPLGALRCHVALLGPPLPPPRPTHRHLKGDLLGCARAEAIRIEGQRILKVCVHPPHDIGAELPGRGATWPWPPGPAPCASCAPCAPRASPLCLLNLYSHPGVTRSGMAPTPGSGILFPQPCWKLAQCVS